MLILPHFQDWDSGPCPQRATSTAPWSGTRAPIRETCSTGKGNWASSCFVRSQCSRIGKMCLSMSWFSEYNRSNNAHADKLEECRQFQSPTPGKVCNVRLDQQWHPCVKDQGFNYDSKDGGPCIFLKLNRVSTQNLWLRTPAQDWWGFRFSTGCPTTTTPQLLMRGKWILNWRRRFWRPRARTR